MIFKKLLKPFVKPFAKPFAKPLWQSEDPQARIKALQDLTADEPKYKTILHELAFNDASDKVRRLALERLNDFSLWWQASKTEKNDKLKKLAEQNIRAGLLGKASFVVDESLKNQFIEQCNKSALLEELALKDENDNNRLKLLEKLNKPQLFMQSIQDSATSVWLKTALVEKLDDLPLLEKLNKKSDDSIKLLLTSKIDGIKAAIEKPLVLKKDIGLMLAKLNALKDKVDIELIEQKTTQLTLEWETLQEYLSLLSEEEAAEFTAKFNKINASLNTIIAPLKEKWLEQKAQVADAQEKADNAATITSRLADVEALLTAAISEHNELSEDSYSAPLKKIQEDIQQLNLADTAKKRFIGQIEQFYQKISEIPLITECMTLAKTLLEQMQQLAVPTDSSELKAVFPDYQALQKQWRDNQKKIGLAFPESIVEAYKTLSGQWQSATGPLLKEQEELFSQAKKALSELKHLLAGGKYRRAFGVFKKLDFFHSELDEAQQGRLARDFDKVKKQVEDLADWQQYIAAPRKQQILEDMLELAEKPLESPQEQAKKVRFTRQMWNSLSTATTSDGDAEMDQQFNDACEKAFEICRVFYAEKDVIRANNLATKQAICERLSQTKTLLEQPEGSDIGWQQIESTLSQVRKDWRNSGEVDRQHLADINQRYYDLLKPLQSAVKANQAENASLKEALVDKAKALLEIEDVFAAVNQLKDIQQGWKKIGFAGGKTDSALWRKFRQANDLVFNKRDAFKQARDEEGQQQLTHFNEQLGQIEAQIKAADQLAELGKSGEALQALSAELDDAPKYLQGKILPKLQVLQTAIDTAKKQIKLASISQGYIKLFEQFEYVSNHGELNPDINCASAWNGVLGGLADNADAALRYDLTIGLEIAQEVESPVRDSDRRMALQMEMLSNKMNGGVQEVQKDELLKQWFAVGKLGEDDQELLERVRVLFV